LSFIKLEFLKRIVIVYTSVIAIILLLIFIADVFLFKAWGSRIDATPLKYFSNPKEMWASISHLPVFWIGLAFVVFSAGLIYFIRRYLKKSFNHISVNKK